MDLFEQDAMLQSMQILVDTREQNTERAQRRYATFGVPYSRATLSYGDYCYNAQLPSGEWLFEEGELISAPIVIERKMSLDELAMCFTKDRDRFEREFQRAKANNARIFLLIENATWENLLNGRYRSKFNQNAFLASLAAWIIRYDLQLIFCKEETSGRLIKESLYRDLKERIGRGEYDTR
jgi:ERCC4-type nuclease